MSEKVMNEILKKRIEEAAVEHAESIPQSDERKEYSREDFIAGAEYAISHQFISVEESLPEMEKEVVLFNKNSIRHYEIGWLRKEKGCSKSKWAITNGFVEDDDISHWMPIPKFEPNKTE